MGQIKGALFILISSVEILLSDYVIRQTGHVQLFISSQKWSELKKKLRDICVTSAVLF